MEVVLIFPDAVVANNTLERVVAFKRVVINAIKHITVRSKSKKDKKLHIVVFKNREFNLLPYREIFVENSFTTSKSINNSVSGLLKDFIETKLPKNATCSIIHYTGCPHSHSASLDLALRNEIPNVVFRSTRCYKNTQSSLSSECILGNTIQVLYHINAPVSEEKNIRYLLSTF